MRNEKLYYECCQEYQKVFAMTDEQVAAEYGCDEENPREAVLEAIQADIDFWGYEEEEPESNDGLDPAFGSWAEVNSMFYSPW